MHAAGASRWEALFADLEAQLAAHDEAVRDGEVAELTRAEQALITLEDRLRAVVGSPVTIELIDGESVAGVLRTVAASWVLLDGGPGGGTGGGTTEHVVPLTAIAAVTGLGRQGVPAVSRLDTLGLGTALRELQRDRARVIVRTPGGQVAGRFARVGQDHVDLEETDRARSRLRTVPFWALTRVSRA